MNEFYTGDIIENLKLIKSESINCCVTSPPYFGLRDYGVDGQIGIEQTTEEYVNKLVNAFREVKRVLRNDGTLWLNLGDSIKNKNLLGIPWKVAFALQTDGWYLRSDIIWEKPNPMPESVRDRPTKSHEYIFLLSKSKNYYYDCESIKEAANPKYESRYKSAFNTGIKESSGQGRAGNESNTAGIKKYTGLKNKRDVWRVSGKSFKGAHFAVFPPELIKPCILAGCPIGGKVIDPFGGSGTVALVAQGLGRDSVYIDLNPEYVNMAKQRTECG